MGALIGPYLVDWTAYRERFEREAERAIGQPVMVAGKASLRILPLPSVSFTDVRVGDPEMPSLVVERFRAQVELTPLLKGEVNVLEMTVERPSFSLDIAELERLGRGEGLALALDPARVSLAQVEILHGEALISDSRAGRQWSVSGINAVLEARSLQGPVRLEGGLVVNGEPVGIRGASGRLADGSLPVKLTIAPANLPVTLSADGILRMARPDEPPRFEGTFTLAALPPPGESLPVAQLPGQASQAGLRSEGRFELTPDRLALAEVEIAYGPPERPVHAIGEATIALGQAPRFDVALEARQIDIDRSLGGGPADPVAIEEAAELLLDRLHLIPVPAIPGRLRLDAAGLVVGGSVIQAIGADLVPRGNGWQIEILSALLPGQTRIDLAGDLRLGDDPGFAGRARLNSARPAAFAAWWRGSAGPAARLDSFALEADLDLAGMRQTARDLRLELNGGTITGAVGVQRFAHTEETFVSVELLADRLDLDKGRALVALIGGRGASDRLADRVALDLRADSLIAGGIEARDVVLDGELQAGRLDLTRLAVADLAGARIEARGRVAELFGEARGRLDATLAADSLSGAAEFLESLFPGSAPVARFSAIAPQLAPVDATFSFSAGEGERALALDLEGSFGGTRLSLAAAGDGRLAEPESLSGRLDALIVGDDTAIVLSQLGFDVIPLPDTGPARLALTIDGALERGASVTLDGEAAGTRFSAAGEAAVAAGALQGAGTLEVESADVEPLLLIAGLVLPGIGAGLPLEAAGALSVSGDRVALELRSARLDDMPLRGALEVRLAHPVQASGRLEARALSVPALLATAMGYLPEREDGRWPDAPFAAAIPRWLTVDLALAAEEIDLGLGPLARNGALRFSFRDGGAAIDGLAADFAGGRLKGAASVALSGGQAALHVGAAVEGASLSDLVWRGGGRPVARGTLDASFELSGEGRSLAGVVSTLSGSGSFAVAAGLVRSLNPRAFASLIRAADAGLELERDAVRAAFEGHLDAGTLYFERASGSFSAASGMVRLSTVSVEAPSATVLGSAMADLNDMTLASDWSMKVDPGAERVTGAEPEAGIVFSGHLANPERNIDVTSLLGYLTVRAFEREVERVEALQADVLEKEFFLRQLKRQREERARREREALEAERRALEAPPVGAAEEPPAPADGEEAVAPAVAGAETAEAAPLAGGPQAGGDPLLLLPSLLRDVPMTLDRQPLPLLPDQRAPTDGLP